MFLFSLRPASATPLQESISGQRIKYMGTEGVGTGGQMLNGNNLTEALMERLADAEESVGSSVNYLVGSYKRILQKESTLHAEIRTVRDPETRVRVVEERSSFDQNPEECLAANFDELEALKKKINGDLPTETKGVLKLKSFLNYRGFDFQDIDRAFALLKNE